VVKRNVPSKLLLALSASLIATLTIQAATIKSPLDRTLKVCVTRSRDAWIVEQAEAAAAHMFAEIGIRIEWHHDNHTCKQPAEDFVSVLISTGMPDSEFPGALAYSRLHADAHIEVFYERVLSTVEAGRVPDLLAHVLAHELTHILEDLNRHSETGLMKAHWSQEDLVQMSFKHLPFAQEDIDLIQRAVIGRGVVALGPN
jgi:hypothetical protein